MPPEVSLEGVFLLASRIMPIYRDDYQGGLRGFSLGKISRILEGSGGVSGYQREGGILNSERERDRGLELLFCCVRALSIWGDLEGKEYPQRKILRGVVSNLPETE